LSEQDPLLFLVAPSLRLHPATDTLLRYFGPQIEWTMVGLEESWREEVKVMFRKRPGSQAVVESMPEEFCGGPAWPEEIRREH
jgi:hypothetical protein